MKNLKLLASDMSEGRRAFFRRIGQGALLAAVAGQAYALLRSLVPNVLYEQPQKFKVGLPAQFPEGVTFIEDRRVYVFRNQNTFHVLSAKCTHLGCTVKMVNLNQPETVEIKGRKVEISQEFHCPCHGSKYYGDGTNFAGPAPKPLACYQIEVSPDDGQLVVDLGETVSRDTRLTV
ncbi:MAG TPA: ubiquinol-cytochrome c reductase iron-sulfur subunit [Bryobacteraceae bacterium]|nr:ubiquinol-cytochrome c reductase iron-sulfur subunit [Bryobacteraceae bacterium]